MTIGLIMSVLLVIAWVMVPAIRGALGRLASAGVLIAALYGGWLLFESWQEPVRYASLADCRKAMTRQAADAYNDQQTGPMDMYSETDRIRRNDWIQREAARLCEQRQG